MVYPINRIKHLLQESLNQDSSGPSIELEDLKKVFADLQEDTEPELDFGDIDDFDNDDDDDDDDDDGDDGDDGDDESYLKDKMDVAKDPDSIITDARVIFQKDPKTGKVFLTARLDEMDLPDYFSSDGDEMFKADIVLRIFGKAFANPKRVDDPIDSRVFKKKNWRDKI